MKVSLFVSFLVFLLHLFAYLIHLFVCCIDHVVVIQSCAVFCFGSSQKAKLKWHMIHNCQSWEGSIWKPNKGIIVDIFCRWWMVDLLIHVASFLCQRISNKLPRTPWEGSSPTDNSSHNSGMICALCRCFSYFSYSDILFFHNWSFVFQVGSSLCLSRTFDDSSLGLFPSWFSVVQPGQSVRAEPALGTTGGGRDEKNWEFWSWKIKQRCRQD